MKHISVFALLLLSVFVATAVAGNDYLWGGIGANDYKLAKDTVKKTFFVGVVQSKKYTFKQKDKGHPLTITAVKVTDKLKSNGAVAEIISGGPGSKGVTIRFTSECGHGIKDLVEIWGR